MKNFSKFFKTVLAFSFGMLSVSNMARAVEATKQEKKEDSKEISDMEAILEFYLGLSNDETTISDRGPEVGINTGNSITPPLTTE